MGVSVRKKSGKWYVFVSFNGRRKAKCVGSKAAAEQVKRVLEARLALGDMAFDETDPEIPTFNLYADRWLKGVRRNRVQELHHGRLRRSSPQLSSAAIRSQETGRNQARRPEEDDC